MLDMLRNTLQMLFHLVTVTIIPILYRSKLELDRSNNLFKVIQLINDELGFEPKKPTPRILYYLSILKAYGKE